MSAKRRQQDQIEAIKARVAGLHASTHEETEKQEQPASAEAPATETPAHRHEQARSHFLGHVQHLIANRSIERIPIKQIAPDLRSEMRQLRMVPLPHELVIDGHVPPKYKELADELYLLGESLKERQLQPIVVYPGSSDRYPDAQYLILIGQRRWTAMHLVGLDEIDAVVVDVPSALERVRLQYSENDDREDFSDMERAWALQQMRRAMGDDSVAITEVAAHLNIKRSRAYQLLRLLTFTPEQQQMIVLLRLQERQLLSLTDALHQEKLQLHQVDTVLNRLQEIASERATERAQLATIDTISTTESIRRSGIDAPTVARIVAREVAKGTEQEKSSVPRWYTVLRKSMSSVLGSLHRAIERTSGLGPNEVATLRQDLLKLQAEVQSLLSQLDEHDKE
jgi:ParB/RepB/Spo0J family partition protein